MYSRGLYRWTLGAALFAFSGIIALYLLPMVVPPPEPPGYAPYAFVYNVTYVFPLILATAVGVFLTLILSKVYYSRTRGNDDVYRKWKLLAIVVLLLLPILQCLHVIFFVLSVLIDL